MTILIFFWKHITNTENSNFLGSRVSRPDLVQKHGRRHCFVSKFVKIMSFARNRTEFHGIPRNSTESNGIRQSLVRNLKNTKDKTKTLESFRNREIDKNQENKEILLRGWLSIYMMSVSRPCPCRSDQWSEFHRIQGGHGAPALCLRRQRRMIVAAHSFV